MFVIVGLGNPGDKYKNTRHNLGRMVVESFDVDFSKNNSAKALVGQNESAFFVIPETYMNKSGESVRFFVSEKVSPENLIVVYDDLALPFGEIKVSFGKGSGGHNGIENIINQINTKDFIRVRCGIAPTGVFQKFLKGSNTEYVLKNFGMSEKAKLPDVIAEARDAIEMIMKEGRERAMNRFN